MKPHISYLDKSFKESHTQSYILAMQVNLHGLVLSVFHPDKNKFLALQEYRFTDKMQPVDLAAVSSNIQEKHPWFTFPFKTSYCLVQNSFYTLIPLPLFDEKHKNLYLGFNQPFQENHHIVFDNLKNTGAVNVYYLARPLEEAVKKLWPPIRIIHNTSACIESLSVNFKNKMDGKEIFMDVHEESFDLVYFKENRLYFANSFSYRTKEDFTYFLLAALEQLSLNPEEVKLRLMGKIDKNSEIYPLLYQYIRTISFIETNKNFRYSYLLDNVRKHRYYTLFNILQCEL